MTHNDSTATAITGANIQGIVLYPVDPYLVIVFFLLTIGCFRWGAFFHTKFNSRQHSVRDGLAESVQVSHRGASVFSFLLALVNFYRVLAFRTTFGLRSYVFNLAELFTAVAYVALLFVWTFIIKSDPGGDQLNWCSRAGLLAASQLLFVTVLGTKNNIISLITCISADRLNFAHRLAARACLILVGIHALGGGNNFSFLKYTSGGSELFGVIAALVFVGLAVVSFRPVRQRAYELFFYLHLVAVIIILIATIIHINSYGATKFTYYIWPSFTIWATDRLIRVGRLIYFNVPRQAHGMLDATMELLSDSLVRVTFRRPNSFCWSPGQFAYLIMPSVSQLPFEAHPFSIASVDSALFASDTKLAEGSYGKELVFFIGTKSGFTKRLKSAAERGGKVKVYIDGPYGDSVNLGRYNTSLLIAGGTGITFTLPALLSIIESVRNGSSCCRRVLLVWSIRDADFLNWVSESLTKAARFAPPGLRVDIQVFLTKSSPYLASSAPESQADFEAMHSNPFEDQNPFVYPALGNQEEGISTLPWLKITNGRPNLEYILSEEINRANGRLFVSVCGPNSMAKVVREALRLPWSSPSSPLNGGPSVTLHVESFGYA